MEGLTEAQLEVLRVIAGAGGATSVVEIHQKTSLTRPTLHRVVHSLLGGGLLADSAQPEPARPGRPSMVLGMTAAGWSALEEHREALHRQVQWLNEVLDREPEKDRSR